MNILSQYIQNVLKPKHEQVCFIPSKTNHIANIIKNNSTLSLNRIIRGGSYEKGTMLQYKPDVDIVLVFNKTPGKTRKWKSLMRQVYIDLKNAFPKVTIEEGDNIAIHIKFDNNGSSFNFDIVPSYSVNSPLQMATVRNSKVYQGITTIWHLEYILKRKNIPLFLDTVMLLKDWNNEHGKLLKGFHMELIAASAYEYRLENNYTLESYLSACFREIQGMIDGAPVFPVDWEYFDPDTLDDHYDYPLLIDPADPSQNLLSGLTRYESQIIKKNVSRAISLLENEDYGAIFDPKNKTNFFRKVP
jgi:hypothetical protein